VAITDRNLAPGTTLSATYKKERHLCSVMASEDGSLAFLLADGRRFKSPSAAGSAVMGGVACNGWRWWTVADGATTPGPVVKAAKTAKPKAGRKRGTALLKPLDDQTEAPEGMVKVWCSGCLSAFDAPAEEPPTACPAGHSDQPTA
jgi:hypothetical protein